MLGATGKAEEDVGKPGSPALPGSSRTPQAVQQWAMQTSRAVSNLRISLRLWTQDNTVP